MLRGAFATPPKLRNGPGYQPHLVSLDSMDKDTDTQLFIFNLPSWHNCWALLTPDASMPLSILLALYLLPALNFTAQLHLVPAKYP